MNGLKSTGLSFAYERARPVLTDLYFEVGPGEILALVGPNGSGKSTLVNILAGLLKPSSGELLLDGLSGPESLKRLREKSALMPQNIDHWLLGETPLEDLTLGLELNEPQARRLVDELIQRWSLESLLDRPIESLSLGQKKRVALASALARKPLAVFLDEPLSGLDWPGVKAMLNDLKLLKQSGVITILITHEPGLTAGLTDNWLLLKSGGGFVFGPEAPDCFAAEGVRPL